MKSLIPTLFSIVALVGPYALSAQEVDPKEAQRLADQAMVNEINANTQKSVDAAMQKHREFMSSSVGAQEAAPEEKNTSHGISNPSRLKKKIVFDKKVTRSGVRSYLASQEKYEEDQKYLEQKNKKDWIVDHPNAKAVWRKRTLK